MDKSKELTILIYSCWKNSDMWDIFGTLFRKYWKDCPYRLIMLTDKCEEDRDFIFDDIISLDGSWYEMITNGIKKSNTPYVMLWMDDYLICNTVNSSKIDYYLQKAKMLNTANIRLEGSSFLKPKPYIIDEEFLYFEPGTAYSCSTQIGIWDAEFLLQHLKPEWSAWDFERRGSFEIIDRDKPILSPKEFSFPYVEGVRNGQWMHQGVRLCEQNNIKIDFSKRKKKSIFSTFIMHMKGFILTLNPDVVVKIQNKIAK